MFRLSEKSKNHIEAHVGLKINESAKISAKEINNYIEKKIVKKLAPGLGNSDKIPPWGSLYVYLRHFFRYR